MASSTSLLAEDQTDEDFFNNLVDDEFTIDGSSAKRMVRELSNLSLGDVGTSVEDYGDLSDSESKDKQQDENLQLSEVPQKDPLVFQESRPIVSLVGGSEDGSSMGMVQEASQALKTLKTDESKLTSVRQVQWTAFGVSSQLFDMGGLETDTDFFAGSTNSNANEQKEDDGPSLISVGGGGGHVGSYARSSEPEEPKLYTSSSEQNVHQNDPQSLQNLYPGWQYDAISGQWYQVDGYDTNTVGQVEAYSSATMDAEERYMNHYQGTTTDSSGSDVIYLQQSTPSVLETIEEDSALDNVSNWNLGSQGSAEYPPNMVFDPQYPGWYYDTITGLWHTLESYTEATHGSFVPQEDVSKDVTTTVGLPLENQLLYTGERSFQDEGNQGFDREWSVSTGSHAQQGLVPSEEQIIEEQGTQGFGRDWNYATSNAEQGYMISNEHIIQDQGDQRFTGDMKVKNSYTQPEFISSELKSVQHQGNQGFRGDWSTTTSKFAVNNMWQPEQVGKSGMLEGVTEKQQEQSFFNSLGTKVDQQVGLTTFLPAINHNSSHSNGFAPANSFIPTQTMYQFNQPKVEQNLHTGLSNSFYGSQKNVEYLNQQFHEPNNSYSEFSHPHKERSSDGRPAHALVAFGFGGRLIVMKNPTSFEMNLDHGSQGASNATISIVDLADVVNDQANASSTSDYFDALCRQSYPGPLVGGNAATKDVYKWVDERIKSYESPGVDFQKSKRLKLLLSLLKISCQHYGKLRSPFGSDPSLKEADGPDIAVTKLFASAKGNSGPYGEYGYDSLTRSMQNLPSEGKMQATAIDVQNLLVSGKRKEALQCAQEGQLWGPAIVLAAQLGDQFYVDTVKKMAHHHFVPGSPLRTLCLLIAGQPGDVFSTYNSTSSMSHADVASQDTAKLSSNGMLDDWEENLAVITANRTKDDELVMIHLGDCLWKERGEVTAAHTCYLVAEAKFESHSDSARLCLIGADHWKYPRTYAGPDAIQRTELYEYSKVLGNSQFILLSFQPYKIIYAYMLAEVGKVSESLRYCQACLKSLKNSGRAPEIEMWKSLLLSLEERLRTHQQGGYGTNLAPAKLVGKLFTSIDRSIHRMIGAPPAPLPPMPPGTLNEKETYSAAPKVLSSGQSMMAMPPLISSASVETMSEWSGDSNKNSMHNRSISEPDFGRSPKQSSPKGTGSGGVQKKEFSGGSRFGLFGSQILQKTIGWVSRSHRQAKLGDQNKFYYDDKLKRWVEEGTEPSAEETALPPPPIVATVQNGNVPNYMSTKASENLSFAPIKAPDPVPSVPSGNSLLSQNQFSSRGRIGVRSRYVDTFNKGPTASLNSYQSPAMPSTNPIPSVGARFFVPAAPVTTNEQISDATERSIGEVTSQEEPSTSATSDPSFSLPAPSLSSSLQRYPSTGDISPYVNKGSTAASSGNGLQPKARAASWSGTSTDAFNSKMTDINRLREQGTNSFLPNTPYPSSGNSSSIELNSGLLGDELHEVQL